MNCRHVVLMDLNPCICSNGTCQNLACLIESALECIVLLHPFSQLHEQLPFKPNLVVIRYSSARSWGDTFSAVRSQWPHVALLGIICGEATSPKVILDSVDRLDDFLCCPARDIDLIPRIHRLLYVDNQAASSAVAREIKKKFQLESLVGENEMLMEVIAKIPCVAQTDATVLISGETGTGKELFARAVHYISARKGRPFIPVNCGAVPDHLFENELFGHVKGAFTDASTSGKGLLAEAEGGSLFLDEIDSLSPSAQIKLLRFLQEYEYRPLGSSKSVVANVRIIAATNADLRQRVEAKFFREDLFHRLNVLSLSIPVLRDRRDDIPQLVHHFLNLYGSRYQRGSLHITQAALHKMMVYPWPGNVRELEAVIHRAVVMSSSAAIHASHIELPSPYHDKAAAGSLSEAKARTVRQFERGYLISLMSTHQGNVSRAAKEAGKDRRALQRLLRKHEVEPASFRNTRLSA